MGLPQYSSIDRKFPITVEEVILSGLSSQKPLASRFNTRHREKARHVIARMGLEGMEQRAIGALSGGQLQRALLGRAIISDPQVVILDEPSTYIDKRFEARLYELLTEINEECAIILVSHDIGTVLQQVKSIACVNETLDYHPDTGVTKKVINISLIFFACWSTFCTYHSIQHFFMSIKFHFLHIFYIKPCFLFHDFVFALQRYKKTFLFWKQEPMYFSSFPI